MAVIITYDIDSKHTEFKQAMFKMGYKAQTLGNTNCKIIYLPNTTLYHVTKTAEAARDDAKAVARSLAIELERCIATEWTNWAAICGKPF